MYSLEKKVKCSRFDLYASVYGDSPSIIETRSFIVHCPKFKTQDHVTHCILFRVGLHRLEMIYFKLMERTIGTHELWNRHSRGNLHVPCRLLESCLSLRALIMNNTA